MKLHAYFARRFAMAFLATFGVFFLFILLIDVVEQLRQLDSSVGFGDVLRLTLLNAPEGLYQFLPLILIIASIALFLNLARSSELVVARSVGRSGLASLLGPLAVTALIGVLAVAMGNPIVAATSQAYHDLREDFRSGGSDSFSIGSEGLWLRQGDAAGQTVIRASRASPDASVLYDVSFFTYAPGRGPVRRIEADTATLTDGAWQLQGAKVWPIAARGNPEEGARLFDVTTVSSTLTRDRILESLGTPSAVSVWDLPRFIERLEHAGFSANRHRVWFQMELARPLFLIAMVLVGAAFTMRHSRFGGTGIAVLAAVMLGFGLYYIRNFAQILGENGQLDPLLAAWAPPVASILLATGLILRTEDG
ncbi:LPS export ABC transporter permease LptG [Pseudaestuariivita atlantica]|uniref:Permease n=1 Tax=Pseudaestuariivita atlantica TaxID=1317121 RepID=A0A0L1JLS5_9RHOB|nr:LPS export ABC transporter permease LptG [Pseudaestuariivita atlantica]KNG92358.1 permease [Pseudaestuariivita atlantica]